ncbi:MAG: NAD(P)-dependent oxidoreductase [Burkholderiales bacterium]|nr:NAD(P)-dependent oxidoreductase [Burkholderiales bacterium]
MSSVIPIVVTGAAGFVGSAVLRRLRSLDRPATGISRRDLPGLVRVADYRDTPEAEVIVHLAEESDRATVERLGAEYADAAAAIVDALCRRAGHLVYASSGLVYGDAAKVACGADAPVCPSDAYSRSKLRNEAVALAGGATVLRFSNLFGPGMSENNVVSDIARQLGGEGPLRVRDTSPVRDFLCVDDAAEATLAAIDRRPGGILNIGSGTGLAIGDVARIALAAVGHPERPVAATPAPARRSINVLDIAATGRRLGWQPRSTSRDKLARFFISRATT